MLTNWHGYDITYDEIGNVLSDRDSVFTWEHGRELTSMTVVGFLWQFTYDQNGMRTSRTNGNRVYNYVYNGDSLRQVTVDNHDLNFTYDASGKPLTLIYDGTAYWYDLNLQGDVVGILDSYGNTVVRYTYNAWGCILSITGSEKDTVGFYNPLRYRGYVWDPETGLYYLQSRYYNPGLGRFINADDTAYLGADGTPLSYNLFAYCKNNPVMGYDSTGHFSWNDLFNIAAVVTVAAIAVVAIIGSGGTAAPPLLALASTLAGTTVTASAATAAATSVAITGMAVMGTAATAGVMESSRKNNSGNSSQNNKYAGGSTYNKSGERIDYEYNGNGSGNVHYQGSKGKQVIWTLKDGVEATYTVTKAVGIFISTPQGQRAVQRAIAFVRSLAGF